MLRPMKVTRAVAVVVAAFFLSACGVQTSAPASEQAQDRGRVSFQPAVDVGMLATASGVLGGDAETGCLWFKQGSETFGLVVQDDTAFADFTTAPPVIRDSETVVATFGQEVWLTGGYVKSVRAAVGCSDVGSPFLASDVSTTPRT